MLCRNGCQISSSNLSAIIRYISRGSGLHFDEGSGIMLLRNSSERLFERSWYIIANLQKVIAPLTISIQHIGSPGQDTNRLSSPNPSDSSFQADAESRFVMYNRNCFTILTASSLEQGVFNSGSFIGKLLYSHGLRTITFFPAIFLMKSW